MTLATQEDPFRLGWRMVRELGPDGVEVARKVGLTERDLLFPQEEDFVVQREPHVRDWVYLRETFRGILRDAPSTRVFADHRIDFNLDGVEPLGPDVAVITELPAWDGTRGTLYLADEGKPLLIAEVTSPDTRNNDLGIKREFYARAGVPIYLVVDRGAGPTGDRIELLAHRIGPRGYSRMVPNAAGRVWLAELRVCVGIEADAVWLYTAEGVRFEELPELLAQIAEAQLALQEAAARRAQMEVMMEGEIDARQAEAMGRRMAETGRRLAEQARERAERERALAEEKQALAEEKQALAEEKQALAEEKQALAEQRSEQAEVARREVEATIQSEQAARLALERRVAELEAATRQPPA